MVEGLGGFVIESDFYFYETGLEVVLVVVWGFLGVGVGEQVR